MFSFVGNCQSFFQSGCTILHSHQQRVRVPIAPHLVLSVFSTSAILVAVWGYLTVALIYISLMTYNFYMFICHLYVFFAQVSIKIFGQFSIGLFVYCCILKVIWIFRRIFLYHMCLLQISFSQFVAYPFILLPVTFEEQKWFILMNF